MDFQQQFTRFVVGLFRKSQLASQGNKPADGNGFVNMSASCRSVGIYFTEISFFSICSLVKWYLISMCFVLLWKVGLFAILIEPWLSSKISIGPLNSRLISFDSDFSQKDFLSPSNKAMYSASVDEAATAKGSCLR